VDTDLKIILLKHQNNYVGNSSTMSKYVAKSFDILATSLSVLRNYFDNSIILFLDFALKKILNISKVKLFH